MSVASANSSDSDDDDDGYGDDNRDERGNGGGDGGSDEGGDNDDDEEKDEDEDNDDDGGDGGGIGMTQKSYGGNGISQSQRPLSLFTREDIFDHVTHDTYHGSCVPHFPSYYERKGENQGRRSGKTRRHWEGENSSSHHTVDTLAGSFDKISLSRASFLYHPHPQFLQYPQSTTSSSAQSQKGSWVDCIFAFRPDQ